MRRPSQIEDQTFKNWPHFGEVLLCLILGKNEKKEEVVLEIRGIPQFCFTNAVYVFSQMIIRTVIYFFMRSLPHQIYSPLEISIALNVNLI